VTGAPGGSPNVRDRQPNDRGCKPDREGAVTIKRGDPVAGSPGPSPQELKLLSGYLKASPRLLRFHLNFTSRRCPKLHIPFTMSLDKNLFTLHVTPDKDDPNVVDLVDPNGIAHYKKQRVPGISYTMEVYGEIFSLYRSAHALRFFGRSNV